MGLAPFIDAPKSTLGERLGLREVPVQAELSLSRLYASHLQFVRRAVGHLAGPTLEVDDLVQDVFVQAMKRGNAFEGRSSTQTWLYGIAVRVVANARRRARFRALLGLGTQREPTTPAAAPDFALESAQSRKAVYRVLERLSEKRRAVLILHELEGVPGEQIAQILGCPVGTVWTRLFHARRQFQVEFEKDARESERTP